MNKRKQDTTASTGQVQRKLEQEAAGLSEATVNKLKAARRHALSAPAEPAARAPKRQPLPAWSGALAAGLVVVTVAVALVQRGGVTSDRPDPRPLEARAAPPDRAQAVMTDLELLADDTELAMIEDLDFLAWLSTVDEEIS